MGLAAPKGTPKQVIDTLNAALTKVMAMPTVREKLSKLGATPLNPSPTAFTERVQADRKAWDPVLKTLDLRAN
jgi:tripartite-type tricarboxylate transporter receptor subunit TctC